MGNVDREPRPSGLKLMQVSAFVSRNASAMCFVFLRESSSSLLAAASI
jgi:hypothetical protein